MTRGPALSLLALALSVSAAAWDGDPSITCGDALNQSDGIAPAVDWVAGYIAGRTGQVGPVNRMAIDTAIALLCAPDRTKPLAVIAEELAQRRLSAPADR